MDERRSPWLRRGLPLTALVAGLALLGVLIASAGTRLPGTPEELFAEFQRLSIQGDWATIWDLRHERGQAEYVEKIDLERTALLRNPHPSNDSYFLNKGVTRDQFLNLPHRDLFIAQMADPEYRRWMVGGSIVKLIDLQGVAVDKLIRWEMTNGQQFNLQARDTGRGWTWVRHLPYGRVEAARGE